jgi:hypothetical protein
MHSYQVSRSLLFFVPSSLLVDHFLSLWTPHSRVLNSCLVSHSSVIPWAHVFSADTLKSILARLSG